MALEVAETSLVSPLGLGPSEHVFFHRAEVTPHTSGAFADEHGASLPIHDCPWIPASRPWASRLRLLAKQALARVKPASPKAPILLIAPEEALAGDGELVRFLTLAGHAVRNVRSGAAAYVGALREAEELLAKEPEVVLLAVDSRIEEREVTAWLRARYSSFTRTPPPPSEGAAAMRLVARAEKDGAGQVLALAAAKSEATDDNDVPADGAALTRVLADLRLPAEVSLVVGPRDVDPLRMREFQIAGARHHQKLERAEMPSLEGRIGLFGSAGGLMSAVFALAWLRHGLPLPSAERVALAWARSRDGVVAGVLVGERPS